MKLSKQQKQKLKRDELKRLISNLKNSPTDWVPPRYTGYKVYRNTNAPSKFRPAREASGGLNNRVDKSTEIIED